MAHDLLVLHDRHSPALPGALAVPATVADAGEAAAQIGCHSWQARGITAYLENGRLLEHAQAMAGLASAHDETLQPPRRASVARRGRADHALTAIAVEAVQRSRGGRRCIRLPG